MNDSSIHQGQSRYALFNFPIHTLTCSEKERTTVFWKEFMRLTEKMLDLGKYNLMEIVSTNQFTGAKQTLLFKPANMNIFMM